jgi:ATP-binding cassette subfamily C (CFTR/MRP) protein 1
VLTALFLTGKSTLLQALFRIVELSKGEVEIDGTNIGTLGLAQLRQKLAIIPQEPLLFHGTIRCV